MKTSAPPPVSALVHLCVDMQLLFAAPLGWQVPAFAAILPAIVRLSTRLQDRSLYLRFTVPPSADAAKGCWRSYYHRWPQFIADRLDPRLLELADPLASLARPDQLVDKQGFGGFEGTDLDRRLSAMGARTLVVTGVETDICVLSTVLAAIDKGYRILLATDAVASASPEAHAAALAHIYGRLPEQVRMLTSAEIEAGLGS